MSQFHPVTLLFADGASIRVDVPEGERLIDATQAAGLHLLLDCSNGQCGTCTAQLTSGQVAMDDYDSAILPARQGFDALPDEIARRRLEIDPFSAVNVPHDRTGWDGKPFLGLAEGKSNADALSHAPELVAIIERIIEVDRTSYCIGRRRGLNRCPFASSLRCSQGRDDDGCIAVDGSNICAGDGNADPET